MNGFGTLHHLRQDPMLADVVVIAVSASAFGDDQARSLSAGCQAFLPKPIEANRLLKTLQACLNIEWRYQENGERSAADATSTFVPEFSATPPQEDMQHLHECAFKGDLWGLQQYAGALQQRDARFRPFAAELVQLAKAYQDEQLLIFLEQYMERNT
jgi:CheY-like chemotaxis protein